MKAKSRPVLDAIRELQDYLSKIENAIRNQDLKSAYQDIKDRPKPKRIIDEIEKTLRWQLCQNFPVGSQVVKIGDTSIRPNSIGVVTKTNGYVHVTWNSKDKICHGDPTSLLIVKNSSKRN